MIGFKNTNNKVMVVEPHEVKTNLPNVEELIKMKGLQTAHLVLQEYLCTHSYPLMRGDERDAFFIKKLRKIRELYFESL